MQPLTVPPAAERDQTPMRMPGARTAAERPHCPISVGMWQDNGQHEPAARGIMVAETIRHIVHAMHERHGLAQSDVVPAIPGSLDAESGEPTSDTAVSFEHEHH